MSTWRFLSANGFNATEGSIRWVPIGGSNGRRLTENFVETIARQAYEVTNLHVNCNTTLLTSATTVFTFRINEADGNLTISVAQGLSGDFEDTTNSDSVTDGQTIDTEIDVPADSMFDLAIIHVLSLSIEHEGGDESIIVSGIRGTDLGDDEHLSVGASVTVYNVIASDWQATSTTEADAQYTFRTELPAKTLRNMRVFVPSNNISSTTVRTRVNTANGNQSVSIGDSVTGAFEDTTNSDDIDDGDLINYQIVTSTSMAHIPAIEFSSAHVEFLSRKRLMIAGSLGTFTYGSGTLVVTSCESQPRQDSEGNIDVELKIVMCAENLFVRVLTNSLNAATVISLRENFTTTVLSVSIATTLTGVFEDTTTLLNLDATDKINWLLNKTASSSGSFTVSYIGMTLGEPIDDPIKSMVSAIHRQIVVRAY